MPATRDSLPPPPSPLHCRRDGAGGACCPPTTCCHLSWLQGGWGRGGGRAWLGLAGGGGVAGPGWAWLRGGGGRTWPGVSILCAWAEVPLSRAFGGLYCCRQADKEGGSLTVCTVHPPCIKNPLPNCCPPPPTAPPLLPYLPPYVPRSKSSVSAAAGLGAASLLQVW